MHLNLKETSFFVVFEAEYVLHGLELVALAICHIHLIFHFYVVLLDDVLQVVFHLFLFFDLFSLDLIVGFIKKHLFALFIVASHVMFDAQLIKGKRIIFEERLYLLHCVLLSRFFLREDVIIHLFDHIFISFPLDFCRWWAFRYDYLLHLETRFLILVEFDISFLN